MDYHQSPDHPRSDPTELESLETMTKPVFKEWLTSEKCGPVSCIISDGNMGFVYDVANEIQVPVISALTLSPTSLWVVYNLLNLYGEGEDSNPTRKELDLLIKRVPGIKGVLTGGDLESICQSLDLTGLASKSLMKQVKKLPRAHGVIFNTFKALDGSILSRIRSFCLNIYAIGPVHTHLAVRQEAESIEPLLNYSVDENKNCLAWLDTRQPKSVLYVNIENEVKLTRVQVLELWHGLVNSGKGFLWVRQPESIVGDGRVPPKIHMGTKERGCIVDSASNVQVLAHKAIGGFLTRGQWDLTLQAIAEGVPIICWPSSWDQQVNSKFVSKAWNVGIDVEGNWDRSVIEKTIRDVMESKGELVENATKMKYKVRKSVSKDGSSYAVLDHLR